MVREKKKQQRKQQGNLPSVEKGIKIPVITRDTPLKRFITQLKLGDSFKVTTISEAGNYRSAAKRLGITLSARRIKSGLRVWRVE